MFFGNASFSANLKTRMCHNKVHNFVPSTIISPSKSSYSTVTASMSPISISSQSSPKSQSLTNFIPKLVSIEGNIGAGKSTLLNALRIRHPEWTFVDEPVDLWTQLRNENGESMLEIFYQNRRRWSYTFQNCALLTRFQMIEKSVDFLRDSEAQGKHVLITERCLDTDYHVFTKMLQAEGSIDKLELELYEMLLMQLKRASTPLSAIIHVDTIPEICFERIKCRGRVGEEKIPMMYLKALDTHQRNWLDTTTIPHVKTGNRGIEAAEEFIQSLID